MGFISTEFLTLYFFFVLNYLLLRLLNIKGVYIKDYLKKIILLNIPLYINIALSIASYFLPGYFQNEFNNNLLHLILFLSLGIYGYLYLNFITKGIKKIENERVAKVNRILNYRLLKFKFKF